MAHPSLVMMALAAQSSLSGSFRATFGASPHCFSERPPLSERARNSGLSNLQQAAHERASAQAVGAFGYPALRTGQVPGGLGWRAVIKLSSNEAALGPSPKAIAAYEAAAKTIVRYPPGGSLELKAALAEVHGIDPARIICGNGSDEIIGFSVPAPMPEPGDEVLYTRHGFAMYPIYARSVGATPVAVPEVKFDRADVDAILAGVTPQTRLVFIANPNNPTGTYMRGLAKRLRLRERLREDVILAVDEAYGEFADAADYHSAIDARQYDRQYGRHAYVLEDPRPCRLARGLGVWREGHR